MKLESLLQYLSEYLRLEDFPDYPLAFNGLQVEGPENVFRICAAVDASEAVIDEAAQRNADLLIVHHGLLWDGLHRVTGPKYRKLHKLLGEGIALFSAHLPLDAHAEVGNCALLARELGLADLERFGSYGAEKIGWCGTVNTDRDAFKETIAGVVDGPVRLIPGGPDALYRVAVVTGGAADMIAEAASEGMDALVTGEGTHHTFHQAMEYGVNAYYAGHYATETWGVRALAAHLEQRFEIPWDFIDLPTGL